MRRPIWVFLCLAVGISITGSVALAAPGPVSRGTSQGAIVSTSGQLSISNVQATSITDTSAQISWTTNVAARGQVTYSGNGSTPQTILDVHPDGSISNTTHLVTLTGLSPGQTYSFSVQSSDSQGDNVSAPSQSFTTGPALLATTTYSTQFTALTANGNPSPNTLLFFTTQDSPNGFSETWAGMTDGSGNYSLVLPLRKQDLSSYVTGTNGTLTVTGIDLSGATTSASYPLSNQGSLPTRETITFPTLSVSGPGTVNTTVNGDPVKVSVPAESVPIAQLSISTPATPPAITPVAQDQLIVAIVVSATDAQGNPIHTLSAPLQISITFAASSFNPFLAQIYTLDANGQTQALPTRVTDNGNGTFTATAVTTHLSPFAVYAPGLKTPVPLAYLPLIAKQSPAGW